MNKPIKTVIYNKLDETFVLSRGLLPVKKNNFVWHLLYNNSYYAYIVRKPYLNLRERLENLAFYTVMTSWKRGWFQY